MTNSDTTIIDSSKPSNYSYIHVKNPGTNITQVFFNGKNYDKWSRTFNLALLAKGKLGYIDGTVVKPASTATNFEAWRSANALVTMWIFNSIDSSLRNQISLRPEAKQVWLDIRHRFCQQNDARIYHLQAELVACRQGPTESLMDYYGRLTKLWDDLSEVDPLPACACNPCTCNWVTILDARRSKKRVRDFLMGLDIRFDNARSHILGINPLPSLAIAYNRLLQEEGVRALAPIPTIPKPDTMALAARTHHAPRGTGGTGKPL
ncbi:uncharacterized protein LOC141595490 [Silene latifolia]|uniref:uncharacterized protein LOC141595490 n=1 Tax=Silene latifolia TaxID=37657 RepID=UPI003D77BD64